MSQNTISRLEVASRQGEPLGGFLRISIGVVGALIMALAVLGGVGSFTTVRDAAEPFFGRSAWIVPVGLDVGILALVAWDLLLEVLDLPWSPLRWVAWGFVAGTVAVNVDAAHGDATGSVMHAAMPLLFVVAVEGVRHLIQARVGLANGTRRERIPAVRWVYAPLTSMTLFRRMVLWGVTSYQEGLRMEYSHLLNVARLQQEYGRWAWRWRAPLAERLQLRLRPAETVLEVRTDEADVARAIITEYEANGARLSNAALGRLLREKGVAVANNRLTELATTARAMQRLGE